MKLNDSAPMPFCGGEVDRLACAAARDPQRRVRLLHRLRHDVARRHLEEPAVVAGERLLDEHAGHRVERLVPLLALRRPVDAEAAQLGLRRRLAGAELDPSVGDEVERGDALGDPGRVVEPLRQLHDAVAEPDAARALAGRGEEHLGRRRVAVLLEEVVLDLPHVVDAEPVGELDLVERVLEQPVLVAVAPRPGQLVLVEDAELHGGLLLRGSVR